MGAPLVIEPGMQLGRYRVIEKLGSGGMGGVFDVADEHGTRFALKAPVIDINPDAEVTRRFAREANALRMLDHENLVAAVDVFVHAGHLFLVMEKVVGRPLGGVLADGAINPRTALVFARQILEGVGHAHAQGIVHRDLKPDNILLVNMGGWYRIKIIDFGLVKLMGDVADAFGAAALTRTGIVFGTPAYMAPEQALGRGIDGRTDIYALGVILFEMLVGRLPFYDKDPLVLMRHHAKTPPPRLDQVVDAGWVTPQLTVLVERALAKAPDQRFPSTVAMVQALDAAFSSIDHVA
ncbi:MAG TPA: serine/threonine-protein kinase [Kofleriaceae bacterium]|nr:serine/threonine-protein kinase [Kofleriaceae bacterium]